MTTSASPAVPSSYSLAPDARSNTLAGSLVRAGLEPVSPASLAAFRTIFGLLGFIAVLRFVAHGWISEVYVEPVYHLTYLGFGWVQPWPAWGMYLHFALLGVASLGVALGYRYRLSILAFFLLFTYLELIDQTTYLNHYYLVSLLSLIMVFLPMTQTYSLDSRLHRNSESSAGDVPSVPRATFWVLRTQLGLVYVFAGIAKLNTDWLLDAQPLTIWLYNSTDTPLFGALLREPWLPYAMSWAGAIFDLSIVGWLLWAKARPYAYTILVLFHIITALLFPAIGMFPWIMIGATLIFFDAGWPQRLARRLRWQQAPPVKSSSDPSRQPGQRVPLWPTKVAFMLAVTFLVVQVLLPLRHLGYPGNVRWTEEGYHFSWRVLVTEKAGLVRFRVKSSTIDGERLVFPEQYLTATQVERSAYQPDLILATAHIIRDDFTRQGHRSVEVRTDAFVSFNSRPAARLIDPTVDLASIRHGITPKSWVLPRPT